MISAADAAGGGTKSIEMTRAEHLRLLNEKYPAGISRKAAARELHVSPNIIPVELLTQFVLPGQTRPRYSVESLVNWFYSHKRLGKIR